MTPKIPIAVGTLAAEPSPWRALKMLKAISFGRNGLTAVMAVTQNEPMMKMRRLP